MNIILITQDDPFYLPESIEDFINKIISKKQHKLVAAIVSSPSPFGRNEGFIAKAIKTFNVFGLNFFTYYSIKYIIRKFLYRKSVIKELNKQSLPLIKLKTNINTKDNISVIKKYNPDIIIIIAGNQILKKEVLDIPKYGVYNIHSSLLPDYKGLMPTFWALKNNEKETGVTLYKLTEGIDNGPIVNQTKIQIHRNMSHSDLVKKSKIIGNDLIVNSLDKITQRKILKNNDGGTYYKFPTKNDVNDFYNNGKKFF